MFFYLPTARCSVRRAVSSSMSLAAILLLFLAQAGCDSRKPHEVAIKNLESQPDLVGEALHLYYTKDGKCEMEVITPEIRTFDKKEKKFDEFPRGIKVYGYDPEGNVTSMIEAGYAIYLREKQLWDARQDVIAVNEKGDSIQSERIFWSEREGRVYSEENVRVRTPEATLFGKGFESDDRFNHWEIKRPTGMISLKSKDTVE